MATIPVFTVVPTTDLVQVNVSSPFPGGAGAYTINPWYCASVDVTTRFIAYLKEKLNLTATMSFDWPLGAFAPGSPFQQTGMVPYLDFAGGDANGLINGNPTHENCAGLLMEYYFASFQADGLMTKWFQA